LSREFTDTALAPRCCSHRPSPLLRRYGNLGRFLNHSCTPNCIKQAVFSELQDVRHPHMAFFAIDDIPAMTEFTYDYNYREGTYGPVEQRVCPRSLPVLTQHSALLLAQGWWRAKRLRATVGQEIAESGSTENLGIVVGCWHCGILIIGIMTHER